MILSVVALLGLGTLPRAADKGAEVANWFRDHERGVRWAVWAMTAAMPFEAFIYASLRNMLPTPHCDVFFIGAISIIATTSVEAWFLGGLALHAATLDPATGRTTLDVAIYFGPVLTGATTTMIAPVTLLALRNQAGLPRWLGLLGVVAFVEQAIETITIFGSDGFTEPGGAMNLQLGAGLTIVWIVAFALWGAIKGTPSR